MNYRSNRRKTKPNRYQPATFSIQEMCRVFGQNPDTILDTIESLRKKGFLEAKQLDGDHWEMMPTLPEEE